MFGSAVQWIAPSVIEDGAQIDDGVTVEQFALVRASAKIGAKSRIRVGAIIEGKVGDDCIIDYHCVIRPTGVVGDQTKIWHDSSVAGIVGERCTVGHNCHIYEGAKLGDEITLECNIDVWDGVTIEDGVFIGPSAVLTNDMNPRGFIRMKKKNAPERGKWLPMVIKEGATIGANATILPGLIIGRWAVVAAGAVVTKNVPDFALVAGNPAKIVGWVCECFPVDEKFHCQKMQQFPAPPREYPYYKCSRCGKEYLIDCHNVVGPK